MAVQHNFEKNRLAAEKFLAWLKKKYPVNDFEVTVVYKNSVYVNPGACASIYPTRGRSARIEIGLNRPLIEIARSLAHEWKHVLQLYVENIPIGLIKKRQEMAAMAFASVTVGRYIRMVGEV